jgi:putative oxidoreductase
MQRYTDQSPEPDRLAIPLSDPRHPRHNRLAGPLVFYCRTIDLAGTAIAPWVDLWVRLWLARTFLVSGLLKVGNWDNALALARYEYPVSWMDPATAAYTGVAIELVAPLLLVFGLATRAGAATLLALTLVIQFSYQSFDAQLLWAALLGWLLVRGAGALSLDRLFVRGLADSALPGAAALVRGAAAFTRYGEPVYLLLLRLWLAVALVAVSTGGGEGLGSFFILKTLVPFAGALAVVVALFLAAGLALRPVAIALILIVLGVQVMEPAQLDNVHYLALLLAGFVLYGAGDASLDGLIAARLRRRFPQLDGRPAFDLEGLPRVVVVGAGFGGLACVKALRHTPVDITLIDRHNYHLFQPLLYQVATTALAPGDIAVPIRSLLRDQFNARVLLGEVSGVDSARKQVLIGSRRLPYDYLVLATGASHSYFGRDDWAPFAPGLKQIQDATAVRSRILLAFEQAEAAEDPEERQALLTFLIVGAGPTGVELAGAIAELARFGMEKEFRHLDPASARVVLVQSGPRILPVFPEKLSTRAEVSLHKLGVEVLTDSRVEAIDAEGVKVNGTAIVARTVFWAAGVVASPAGRWLGVACDRSGRVEVGPDLSVLALPEVFVVGDTAASNAWDGKPVPGLGPAAKQAGTYAADVIRARVEGRAPLAPFKYVHLGSLATIGRKAAVADFGFLRLSGTLAWWLWGLVHVYFLAGMRNRISVMLDWAWAYVTFRSSTRLITAGVTSSTDPEARHED